MFGRKPKPDPIRVPERKLSEPVTSTRAAYLKHGDRCDRCGARAYVAAEINGTDLLFCAHHFQRFESAIRDAAAELIDVRWQLETAESSRKDFYN